MATLRIVGVQMNVGPKKDQNLPRLLNLIERSDCDLVVFPEMSLTGHNNDFSDARTAEAWRKIAGVCRQHYRGTIFGTGARSEGKSYVQARAYGDDGELLGTQEKLVPTETERTWVRPGDGLEVFVFREVTFGVLNGNDLWVTPGQGPYHDPRLSYALAQRGVDVIFHLNDSGTDSSFRTWHEANLSLRAREAKCPIITVNTARGDHEININSGVMGSDGTWKVKCNPVGEHHFQFEFETE
jgi:predicted amidohydrolase